MIRPVVGGGGPTYLKQNLFHSRMIHPVVGGGGAAYLKQNLGSDDAKLVQQIERKGVGKELTTCLKHPCFTLE